MFKIAIIGRPNVGKSTLFNKLVGKHFAITDNTPGVTRDRKESRANLGPLRFMAIDTAGLENETNDKSLEKRMFEQTEIAGMPVELIKSTTKLTTSDMTEYQNAIEIWAQTNLGWMWDYNEL